MLNTGISNLSAVSAAASAATMVIENERALLAHLENPKSRLIFDYDQMCHIAR